MARQETKGTVVFVHKAMSIPYTKPWHEVLDEAVEQHFELIRSTTSLTRSGYRTTFVSTKPGSSGAIKPALAKRLQAFVAGFMACEDSL